METCRTPTSHRLFHLLRCNREVSMTQSTTTTIDSPPTPRHLPSLGRSRPNTRTTITGAQMRVTNPKCRANGPPTARTAGKIIRRRDLATHLIRKVKINSGLISLGTKMQPTITPNGDPVKFPVRTATRQQLQLPPYPLISPFPKMAWAQKSGQARTSYRDLCEQQRYRAKACAISTTMEAIARPSLTVRR